MFCDGQGHIASFDSSEKSVRSETENKVKLRNKHKQMLCIWRVWYSSLNVLCFDRMCVRLPSLEEVETDFLVFVRRVPEETVGYEWRQ